MNKMPNITILSSEEYAKALIDKYRFVLNQGVSRNFIHHYAKQCALTTADELEKQEATLLNYTSERYSSEYWQEVKQSIKDYKF
jgi:hypothetical protein